MKKLFSVICTSILLLLLTSTFVSAAVIRDGSNDNTTGNAISFSPGDTLSGSITENDDRDYFCFTLGSAGAINFEVTSYMRYYCLQIRDNDGEQIWYTDYNEYNESVGYRRDSHTIYLEAGRYYLQVNGYRYGTWNKSTGTYQISTSFASSGVNNIEPDNSFVSANDVTLGNTLVGQISANDDYDLWKLSLQEDGDVKLTITSYMRYYQLHLYDFDGKEIWYSEYNEYNANVGYRKDEKHLYLSAGVYYLRVAGYQYGTWNKSTGKYTIGTMFTSSRVSFQGDNNSFATANSISLGTTYRGQVAIDDDYDLYQFTLNTGTSLSLSVTSYMKYYQVIIYNSSGTEVWHTDYNEWNENVGYRRGTHRFTLSAGSYYLRMAGYQYGTWNKSTGVYEFTLRNATASVSTGTSSSSTSGRTGSSGSSTSNASSKKTREKAGTLLSAGSGTYKVLSGGKTVSLIKGAKNTTVSIPGSIVHNGYSYKVTQIAAKAFYKNTTVHKVSIGANVKKIGKSAFAGCKRMKYILIYTGKLTSKRVGSGAFKVPKSTRIYVYLSKSKIKSYKKWIKKKGYKGKHVA